MKHPSVQELYDYWNRQRGTRAAPNRAEIEPSAIRRVLADTFILAYDTHAGHTFRIAGTRLCAALGRELRGRPFVDLWADESARRMRDLLSVVTHECTGAVAGVHGRSAEGAALDFELLLLPLNHRTPTDARVLGALVPSEAPYWLGTNPLEKLTLSTIRYLGHADAAAVPPRLKAAPPQAGGRLRRGLIVYDGGQV
jgi:hypothetical protein